MTIDDMSKHISSKDDYIQLFAMKVGNLVTEGGYFLPQKDRLTWSFIRATLCGDKKLIKVASLTSFYCPPKLTALSCEDIWDSVKDDHQLMKYFPDGEKHPGKHFMITVGPTYQVLNHLRPTLVTELLKAQKELRKEQAPPSKKVAVSTEILDFLTKNEVINPSTQKDPMSYVSIGRKWARTRNSKPVEFKLDLSKGTVVKK